jgi:hypothetical protein
LDTFCPASRGGYSFSFYVCFPPFISSLLQAAPELRSNQSVAERSARRKRLNDVQTKQADIEARKAALLKQLDEIELEVQLLKQEHDDLQLWLNLPNNFIDRLPDEILMDIFQEYVYSDCLPEALLLVSRRWFHTAIGTKSLWIDLKVPLGAQTPERASRFIHRHLILSDPSPIEVNYDTLAFIWDTAKDGRWFPTSVIVGKDGRLCRRVIQLTIGHRETLAFLEWPLPRLEQLTYGPAMLPTSDSTTQMLKTRECDLNPSKMPNLRALHMRYLTLEKPPSILSNIRTLKLSICPLTYDPHHFQVYIAAAMHLHTLKITFTPFPPNTQQAGPTGLVHPRIRSLDYHDQSIAADRCLLGWLDIPTADNLNIGMHDLKRIASLARRTLDQLLWLQIEVFSKNSRISQHCYILVDLLRQANRLQELTLVAACSLLAPELMNELEADDSLCPELRTLAVTSVNVLDGTHSETLEQRIRDRYDKLHRS